MSQDVWYCYIPAVQASAFHFLKERSGPSPDKDIRSPVLCERGASDSGGQWRPFKVTGGNLGQRSRERSLWQGVSLRGDASFVSVPVTGAPRRDHASRPIGQRGRERDGKIPLPESAGMLSHMTDTARSHGKMRQIVGNQLHCLKRGSLYRLVCALPALKLQNCITRWKRRKSFRLCPSVGTTVNCLSLSVHSSRFEAYFLVTSLHNRGIPSLGKFQDTYIQCLFIYEVLYTVLSLIKP